MSTLIIQYDTPDFILELDVLEANFKYYCVNHNREFIDSEIIVNSHNYILKFNYKKL